MMEITTKTTVDIRVRAIFENGYMRFSLVAISPYDAGKRSVTVTLEPQVNAKTKDTFAKLFAEIIEENQKMLLQKLEAGRAEVVTAAARLGEL